MMNRAMEKRRIKSAFVLNKGHDVTANDNDVTIQPDDVSLQKNDAEANI